MTPRKSKKTPAHLHKAGVQISADDISLRWMIQSDYDAVIEIERQSFDYPWTKAELSKFLKRHTNVGYVAILNGHIVGYYLYELHPSHIELIAMAVHPDGRRIGVGRKIMQHIERKLNDRRPFLKLMCREANLIGQKFFRAVGCLARGLLQNAYDGTIESGVMFEKKWRDGNKCDERWLPVNRVGKFFEQE